MSASSVELTSPPRPAVGRPAAWPYLIAALAALAVPLARGAAAVGWLGGGAAIAAFFAGRRRALWMGPITAVAVAAAWMIFNPHNTWALAGFLAAMSVWFALRFRDDPAPVNGLIAGVAICALALVNRFGVVGGVLAAALMGWRFRPIARVWPVALGLVIGWLVARALPWF